MLNGICKTCKKSFRYWAYSVKRGGGQYCSMACRRTGKVIKCQTCKKPFYVKPALIRLGAKYCSRKCTQTGLYASCQNCQKLFYIERHRPAVGRGRFCGKSCSGRFFKGEAAAHWKGGISPYLRDTVSGTQAALHRLIAQGVLGRDLSAEEIIHHINFKKKDNRPENLYLFPNKGEHTAYHHAYRRGEIGLLVSNLIH